MKNTMNAKVFCRRNNAGTLDFYLSVQDLALYLFTTRYYSENVLRMYYNGRRVEEAYRGTAMPRQQRLRERILRMARYVADENELMLFRAPGRNRYPVKAEPAEPELC